VYKVFGGKPPKERDHFEEGNWLGGGVRTGPAVGSCECDEPLGCSALELVS
jgi:hypothetical protein